MAEIDEIYMKQEMDRSGYGYILKFSFLKNYQHVRLCLSALSTDIQQIFLSHNNLVSTKINQPETI